MVYGTSHFVSTRAAREYYAHSFGSCEPWAKMISPERVALAEYVADKLASGEIHIGQPVIKPGQRVYLNQQEGRYFIDDGKA